MIHFLLAALLAPAAAATVKTIPVLGEAPAPLTATLGDLAKGALPPAAVPPASPVQPGAAAPVPAALAAPAVPAPAAAPEGPAAAGGILPELAVSRAELIAAAIGAAHPLDSRAALNAVFSGSSGKLPRDWDSYVVNDEGIPINGRSGVYYKEVKRAISRLSPRVDLTESLGVMDDTYADVWSKLKTIEAVAGRKKAADSNVHLEQSLLWVDGVVRAGGRTTAIHTYRVFYHPAPNPRSEIEEGLRRAGAYLKEVLPYFAPGGPIERGLDGLDEVVLAFDTRGYREIKAALKSLGKDIEKATAGRIRFAFVDDLNRGRSDDATIRRELRELVARFRKQEDGLQKIVEGVTYSRYVGLLLELETVEHYLDLGYTILQSGRELFDADGKYVTELDAVVRSPEGVVTLVEARAARVRLPIEKAVQGKVRYKLEAYRRHRALLEKELGAPLRVVFSMDVGRNADLAQHLKNNEEAMSAEFGFPVSFLFLESGPSADSAARQGKKNKKRRR